MSNAVLHAFHDEAEQAQRLAHALGVDCTFVETHTFPDGEIVTYVPKPARTTIVYRSLDHPNPKLVELMLAQDAWWRAGAERLVLVAPYLCYMRQDHVDRPGAPVSQQAIGGFLARRFDRIITVDPHLHRTPDLSEILTGVEAECVSASAALKRWIKGLPEDSVLIGPDAEAAQWVKPLARNRRWGVLAKDRISDTEVRIALPDGIDVEGHPVVLVDDVCSTGATLIEAARVLRQRRPESVTAIVTHALFDKDTTWKLREAGIEHVTSTDSVTHPTNRIALAQLLADAVKRDLAP